MGATPYIPFRANSLARNRKQKHDSCGSGHYYNFNRKFLAHYHKRSNVETTFAMIKAKFGGAGSKTPVAQVNEVLVKILCQHLRLDSVVYELGIEPIFGSETFGTEGGCSTWE